MFWFVMLALAIGLLLPIQAGVNAQLRTTLGQPLGAALVSFLVGTAGLAILAAVVRLPLPLMLAWGRSPWWHWVGGLLGAVYVAGAIVLAPRLGAASLLAAAIGGQMLSSLVLDHYGWVGFAVHPITPLRLLGALLVIGGVVLIQR